MPIHKCYVEVFAGGLWVLLNKPVTKPEVINDINNDLINFWEILQNDYEAFKNKCKYLISSRHLFEKFKNQKIQDLSSLDKSVRFFYLNRTCFGGDMNKPRFGTSNIRRSNLGCVTDDVESFLSPIYNRIKDVTIENLDYKTLIPKYDIKQNNFEKQDVLFYIDPPYIDEYGYGFQFDKNEHYILANLIKNIKGKFILSINNHPLAIELYKDFYFIDKELKCSLSKNSESIKTRKELIITNFEI